MVTMLTYQYEDDYFLSEYSFETRHILNFIEMSNDSPWLDMNNFFVEGLTGDDYVDTIIQKELIERKDAHLDKHSPKKLPVELLENYQKVQEASDRNPLKVLNTIEERLSYIKKMERVWNRSTQQHIRYMQSKDYEGNVDERAWYRIAIQLKKEGFLEDLEV